MRREGLGFKTLYWDTSKTLALGNAVKADSMEDLLSRADIVTLHVPETPETRDLITATEIAMMKTVRARDNRLQYAGESV